MWNGILPMNIYCQSLGALFDDVIQQIAWEVLQLEVKTTFNVYCSFTLSSLQSLPFEMFSVYYFSPVYFSHIKKIGSGYSYRTHTLTYICYSYGSLRMVITGSNPNLQPHTHGVIEG